MKKRVLSFLLAALMAASLLGAAAEEAQNTMQFGTVRILANLDVEAEERLNDSYVYSDAWLADALEDASANPYLALVSIQLVLGLSPSRHS